MTRKVLNNYKMSEAISLLKEATYQNERKNFIINCNNCTLDIVAGGMLGKGDETIEIALLTETGNGWLALDLKDKDGNIFTLETPIIYDFPLIYFTDFVKQFKSASNNNIPIIWDAWYTIVSCM